MISSNGRYVAVAAQITMQRRLETIANNVANASTPGYRAEQVRFATVTSRTASPAAAFPTVGQTFLSAGAGETMRTDNPLDVAVDGDAWLAVDTPLGIACSRDGRLQMAATGELKTLTGHAVLDVGGTAIQLDPGGGAPAIARDGTITQGGRTVGRIGLFSVDPTARLTRGIDGTVLPDIPATPVVDHPATGMRQGFLERSNVNTVVEMSRMILDQRLFEAVASALSDVDQSAADAIKALGAG